MFNIGRICVKVAGRDAGQKCVIVQELGNGLVLVDGQTRRRKCNVKHLEPTAQTIDLKENATHDDVKDAFAKLNIEVRETKPKQAGDRPKKQKAKKAAAPKAKKAPKKEAKKAEAAPAKEVSEEKPAATEEVKAE